MESSSRRFLALGSSAMAIGTAMPKATEDAVPETLTSGPEPMVWPESSTDWRNNMEALAPIAANSPLETRQQRRAAQKALARGLATTGKLKEREERVLDRRRKRADAAHARHKRIAEHVPNAPTAE